MSNNLNAPRWQTQSIYKSAKSEDFLNDLNEMRNLQKELCDYFNSPEISTSFPQWLASFLPKYNRIYALATNLYAFVSVLYMVDTTNAEFINNISTIDEEIARIEQIDVKFKSLFAQKKAENSRFLEDFYTSFPQYRDYEFLFEEILLFSAHQMSAEKEELASLLSLSGADSFSRLQEQIISNLKDEKLGKTFNEIRNDAYSASRETRKTAFYAENALLENSKIPLAACLNGIKGTTITLNRQRNWQSALDKAMAQSRLSKKTLDALIGAIEKSLPIWQEYLKTKAQLLLGKDTLAFYDIFAPLQAENGKEKAKVWSFEETKQYIIEKFSAFSPDFGNFARNAFDNNWIDAEIRPGKVGGGCCLEFPIAKESRILTNYTGTFSDVTTIAHELGHAYHFECLKNLDHQLTRYPMTLAETASIFAETILTKDMIKNASGFERAKIIEIHLQDCCQVLVDILSRFYFEKSVFEKRQNGELMAEDFCALMEEAQEKTYGKALDTKHPYMWAVKSHYYSPYLDFYNFPYAFGQLFSAGLYAQYVKKGNNFAETYKKLLLDTGKLSCEEVCKKAGFDIQTEEFWLSGIESMKEELEELKAFAKDC